MSGNAQTHSENQAAIRWNSDPLWAFLLGLAALGANAGFFVAPILQTALPWISLALAVLALIFLGRGLKRAISTPALYRVKALSVIFCLLTLSTAGMSLFMFQVSRKLPNAGEAPQVGQRVPDFTLDDTQGKPVSLNSFFAAGESTGTAPKAVLLIFYRGYW